MRGRLFCGKNFLTEFLIFLMCMLNLFSLLKLKLRKPVVLQTFLPCSDQKYHAVVLNREKMQFSRHTYKHVVPSGQKIVLLLELCGRFLS